MPWSVEYFSPEVEQAILELPDGLLSRYLRLTDLMLELGSNLGMPHTRAIDSGLFELRVKSKEGVARLFLLDENWEKNHHAPYVHQENSKNTKKGIEDCF